MASLAENFSNPIDNDKYMLSCLKTISRNNSLYHRLLCSSIEFSDENYIVYKYNNGYFDYADYYITDYNNRILYSVYNQPDNSYILDYLYFNYEKLKSFVSLNYIDSLYYNNPENVLLYNIKRFLLLCLYLCNKSESGYNDFIYNKKQYYKKLKDGEYKVYGVIYWSYLLRKKYYKVFLKFSVYNNYYNYYIYKAFSFSFYLIKMVIKKTRIELLYILDSDIYKLNYLFSVLKNEKSIISKYVSSYILRKNPYIYKYSKTARQYKQPYKCNHSGLTRK